MDIGKPLCTRLKVGKVAFTSIIAYQEILYSKSVNMKKILCTLSNCEWCLHSKTEQNSRHHFPGEPTSSILLNYGA